MTGKSKFSIFILAVLSAALMFSISGCKKNEAQKDSSKGKIQIVATNFPCYDFARQCVKDTEGFDVKLLIKPGMEVHSYDPTPSDIIAVQNSDIFIYVGGESDEWVRKILNSSEKKPEHILCLMDYTQNLDETSVEGMEGEETNKHEKDEHIWTSSSNAIEMISQIKISILSIEKIFSNPTLSQKIRENAASYCDRISEISGRIKDAVNSKEKKVIVVGDRFPLRYFADEYGLDYRAAFNGCSTSVESKTNTISYLIDFASENDVPAIFAIEMSNRKIAKTIAEGTSKKTGKNVEVLELNSAQNVSKSDFEKGITYADILEANLVALQKGLR